MTFVLFIYFMTIIKTRHVIWKLLVDCFKEFRIGNTIGMYECSQESKK